MLHLERQEGNILHLSTQWKGFCKLFVSTGQTTWINQPNAHAHAMHAHQLCAHLTRVDHSSVVDDYLQLLAFA